MKLHYVVLDADGQQLHGPISDPLAATLWLTQQLLDKSLPGDLSDYQVKPCDESGNLVVRVSDSARQIAADTATKLLGELPELRKIAGVTLASRQLYVVAVTELEKLLANQEGIDDAALVAEVVIQTVAKRASEPFEDTDLFSGLHETVLPWLANIVKDSASLQKEAEMKAAKAQDAIRRETAVPVGFVFEAEGMPVLKRQRPLILVGSKQGLEELMSEAAASVIRYASEDYPLIMSAIWLGDVERTGTMPESDDRLVVVDKQIWSGCAASNAAFPRMFMKSIRDRLSRLPDLLMCGDLLAARQPASRTRKLGFVAAEAVKPIMDFCEKLGMAFIGGVPTEEPFDLADGTWDTLKAHATVASVDYACANKENGVSCCSN